MRLDAETDGPALYSGDDDPRLTKVGGFLRKHHLDELPQLWNVFIGDMAFVGYRPERKYYIDKIIEVDPRYAYLYQIRPGVTSYATLKNGYTDSLDKMLFSGQQSLTVSVMRGNRVWLSTRGAIWVGTCFVRILRASIYTSMVLTFSIHLINACGILSILWWNSTGIRTRPWRITRARYTICHSI